MTMTTRSRIIKIGNSRGVRIPRTILEQVGLFDDVEMVVEGNNLIIHSLRSSREGWAAQFAAMAEHGDDCLFDQGSISLWDEEEWTW
ncbi:MAG: AbrB/MazE/SpoVT family DNA-binding domain-containing protein [Chloroflexi bacterium]|nr:AbrB/MazE/SpoVT family DNA-binding domain-containing protein [Chloroflexota bacterium]